MKFSAFISAFLFIILFSFSNFSQIVAPSGATEASSVRTQRTEQIKAGILQDIKALKKPDQARNYTQLGKLFWEKDKKEGIFWLSKGIEIALNPATNYKDNREKFDVLKNILVFDDVFEKDEVLGKRLLSGITEILFEELKTARSGDYGASLIFLAGHLLKRDEKFAFDLAILSLKGKKPVIDWNSFEFFMKLKMQNEALANQYFARIIEVVKLGGDNEQLKNLVRLAAQYYLPTRKPPHVSEPQMRELLDVLAPFIQKESEDLLQKNRNDCELTISYATLFLDDYKKLLPQKTAIIEQAINACQMSAIDDWKKPDFNNKKRRTSLEYLESAKAIGDKEAQARFLLAASAFARYEKNYRLSIRILDGIDEDLREKLIEWEFQRVYSTRDFIVELFKTDGFAEIQEIIEKTPPGLRPYIILDAAKYLGALGEKNKQITFDLLNRAKAEFNKMDFPPPADKFQPFFVNPAKFKSLVNLYYRLGYRNEALETYEEFIALLNHLSRRFAYENKDGEKFSYYYYSSLPAQLVETDFELIYQNIGKIEALPVRLIFKFNLLEERLSGAVIGASGAVKISY